MCEGCFLQIANLRNGDEESLNYFSDSSSLRNATEEAKKYIKDFLTVSRELIEKRQLEDSAPPETDRTASWPKYDVIVTTTDNIAGREITDYLGIVSSRAYMTEIMALFEGTNRPEKPNEAAKESLRYNYKLAEYYLKKEAAELGANAVIGVRIEHVRSNPGLLITMTGTAVIVE